MCMLCPLKECCRVGDFPPVQLKAIRSICIYPEVILARAPYQPLWQTPLERPDGPRAASLPVIDVTGCLWTTRDVSGFRRWCLYHGHDQTIGFVRMDLPWDGHQLDGPVHLVRNGSGPWLSVLPLHPRPFWRGREKVGKRVYVAALCAFIDCSRPRTSARRNTSGVLRVTQSDGSSK
jgi:hypothetical protein